MTHIMSSLTLIIICAEQLIDEHLMRFQHGFIIRGLLCGPFLGRFFNDLFDRRLQHTLHILGGRIADIYLMFSLVMSM